MPVDSLDETDETNWRYKSFCQIMLDHVPGSVERRAQYLYHLALEHLTISAILHPRLHHLRSLFLQMACYLSLPWKEYEDLQPNHAHNVFLLLLFPLIEDLHENDDRNIKLMRRPRPF